MVHVHIHANCAVTLDGAMGMPGPKPLRISSEEDITRVHALRADSDAILVGAGTVLADDPKLDVKWDLLGRTGKNPLRVVLDGRGRVPEGALVLDERAPSVVFTARGAPAGKHRVAVDRAPDGGLDLAQVLKELGARGVRRLMIEGGGAVMGSFLSQDRVDVMSIYVAPRILGTPGAPRLWDHLGAKGHSMAYERSDAMGEGVVVWFARKG
jgi:2,5-diamino-6-(ribosylamino)-4(3H)-pyrimidinone 5'-phosphate reductase